MRGSTVKFLEFHSNEGACVAVARETIQTMLQASGAKRWGKNNLKIVFIFAL